MKFKEMDIHGKGTVLVAAEDISKGETLLESGGEEIFSITAKMKHSCKPAVQCRNDNDKMETEVRALRDIKVGEKITVSWLLSAHLKTRRERMMELETNWGFVCSCSVCSLKGEELEMNERLREKVREKFRKIEMFFNFQIRYVKDFLCTIFVECKETLSLLENDLQEEADPAAKVTVLLYLAKVAELAGTSHLRAQMSDLKTPK